MAMRIQVAHIPPYDGEYEFDDRALTTRELRWIKQIAGYLPMTLSDGLEGGDADVFIALTVIAMQRAGKIDRDEVLTVADRLADEPLDDARIRFVGEETDSPPAPSPSTNGQHESSPRNSSGSRTSSGAASDGVSENQDRIPPPIGATR